MKKLFLNEETIEEALPKDLADTYVSNYGKSFSQTGKFRNTDFQAAEYTEISPEEARAVIKSDPESLRLIIVDRSGADRVVSFEDRGYPKAEQNFYLPREKAYKGLKGDKPAKYEIKDIPGRYLLTIAKKIYKTNEKSVNKDPNLVAARRQNPESKYVNPVAQQSGKGELVKVSRDIELLDDGTVRVPGSYGGTGDADYWREKYNEYLRRWGAGDSDTKRAYMALMLAATGRREFYDTAAADAIKRAKANIRYTDVASAIRAPMNKLKSTLQEISDLEYSLASRQSRLDKFRSPEQRANRESSIKQYIDMYKSRLTRLLADLESYEMRLEDLDAADLKQINEYTAEINDLTAKVANAKNDLANIKSQGVYSGSVFGRKVPESAKLSGGKLLKEAISDSRAQELADYLDINIDDIDEVNYADFDTPEGEFLVLTEDEAHTRAVDEIKSLFEDMGLDSFTKEFKEWVVNNAISDDVVDKFIDDELDYYSEQEPDEDVADMLRNLSTREEKLDYIKGIFGDLSEFFKKEDFDTDLIAEEAIDRDGVAHFIAYYDGDEIELPNYYAYRIN